jgi:hypothetical protein
MPKADSNTNKIYDVLKEASAGLELGLQNNDSRKEHDASQLAATSASKSEV